MASVDGILAGINEQEMEKFQNIYFPLLEQIQSGMGSRRADYVSASDESVEDTADLYYQTQRINDEVTGQLATSEQTEASNRAKSLGLTSTRNQGANSAVDTADSVNKSVASGLLNVQTNLANSAISDASSASGLASSRTVQNANAKQAADAQNQQTAGMALAAIAMMM